MKNFLILFLVIFSLFSFGCDKRKALATIRQADELTAKLYLYGRNIAKANNDSFEAGNISRAVHHVTNEGVDKYLKGVDKFAEGIGAAKKAIAAGASANGQVDILEALFNQAVRQAGIDLVASFVNIPPALKEKLAGWGAAIELAITTFTGLFADARQSLLTNTA